jgi:hypothetical protein
MTKKKAKPEAAKADSQPTPETPRFFELVNWKKAQPRMKGRDNPWMKLYTSLLDNDAFAGLDDPARMLIVALWLYAARSGQHVFPADPKWLGRKIPMLNSEPELRPLLEAADIYGNPTPFVRYCDPPKPKAPRARKPAKTSGGKKQGEESRGEQTRPDSQDSQDLRAEGNPSGDGNRVEREEKKGPASNSRADQSQSQATTEQTTSEPEDPTNPDALGHGKATRVAEPAPGSDKHTASHRRRRSLSSAVRYDRHDIFFARRVFRALALPGDPDGGAIDQLTSMASVWREVRLHYCRSPPEQDQLGIRLLKEAATIARRAKPRDNRAAIWNANARKIAAGRAAKL